MSAGGRRLVVSAFAGPEALVVEHAAAAAPGEDEVVVAVEASSATSSDSVVRRGLNPYMGDLEPPFVLGYDLVGRVTALGARVDRVRVGDRVAAITRWGANADEVVVGSGALTLVSSGLDATLVEPLVMTGATAAAMVRRLAPVTPGQVVYVHGGSGGVGLLAVQAALLLGAEVIAAASPDKWEALERVGAATVDYRDPDLPKRLRELAPTGADLVLDAAGGAGVTRAASVLKDGGTLISFGFAEAARRAAGRSPEVLEQSAATFATTAAALEAITASARGLRALQFDITTLRAEDPDAYAADLAWLIGHIEAGRLEPVVRAIALEDAQAAHRAVDEGSVAGRLVFDHTLQPQAGF